MEKEKTGKQKLSESAKKRSKRASDQQYRARRKLLSGTMKLPVSLLQRWRTKAMELRMSNTEFAKMLLDIHENAPHQRKTDVPVQGPSLMPVPLVASTPLAPLPRAAEQGSSGSSAEMSDISGVAPLQSPSQSGKSHMPNTPAVAEEEAGELDISVDYKIEGDFVYPADEFEEDAVSDDMWEPVVSIRRGKSCVGLEYIATGEEVFGMNGEEDIPLEDEGSDEASFTRSGLHKVLKEATGIAQRKFFIISEERLRELSLEARPTCSICQKAVRVEVTSSGTSPHISWICEEGHMSRFCGQEVLHRSHIGDLQMASALFLSGNNFAKIQLMFRFMNLPFLHPTTYHSMEKKYVIPAVEEDYEALQNRTRDKHRGKDITILGDGRNDSPGHCAQYLTYTIMENDTKDVIHVEVMDKRQAGMVSGRMEPKALMKSLDSLKADNMKVAELVTDAHTVVTCRMRESHPDIKHSYDVWHGAKNLGKKISKVSLKAANRPLTYWQNHITNHFWSCCKTCDGSADVFKQKWRGMLHHVTDKHEWSLGGGTGSTSCEHGELPPCKEYLAAGSPPHASLVNIAMDKQFMKNIPFFVNFRHTGELESLNSHILMYASKRFSFGFVGYRARNLLAVMDYMHHKDRPVKKDADGNDMYVARWSKKASEYTAVTVRVPKTYDYIPSLMSKALINRLEDMQPLRRPHVMRDDDPRRIQPRLASKPPPPIHEILERRHISRF